MYYGFIPFFYYYPLIVSKPLVIKTTCPTLNLFAKRENKFLKKVNKSAIYSFIVSCPIMQIFNVIALKCDNIEGKIKANLKAPILYNSTRPKSNKQISIEY